MKKKIAIIGGSYLQLPVVKKAQDMGLEVYSFSWEDGAVCKDVADYFYPISIIEKEKIVEVCKTVKVDGVATIASDVAVLTVNYIANTLGLISNSEDYSQITTNKYLMRNCFVQNNVPSPRFKLSIGEDDIDTEGMSYPLIVKPTDRSGSMGVEKVDDPSLLKQAVIRACKDSFSSQAIIEEYVSGREISVESISWKGTHHILAITDKVTTGEPFFVELAHHEPSTLPQEIQQNVQQIVLKALDALHICYGASHAELKITKEGDIRIIEIGARMGGDFIGSDLVYLSTGYDFLKGVVQVAMGEFEKPVFLWKKCSGVYFLSKETEKLKDMILHKECFPEIVRAEITDPMLRNIECSGDRSGYFIYQSDKKFCI